MSQAAGGGGGDDSAAPRSVPVLLLTGPVGVGKSTIGLQVARLLREAGVPGAFVDLAWIGEAWPAPPDDPWNERLTHRNLAALWANFRDAGATRLVVCRVLEARSLLRHLSSSVPDAIITVVRLRAPVERLHERIRARDAEPDWFLQAASYLAPALEAAHVEDFVVDNDGRPPREVARLPA